MNIGFVKSKKENEKRVAIVYDDILKIKNKSSLFFEEGYLNNFGVSDFELRQLGCNVTKREEILKCDVICDPKIGDAEYLPLLNNQIIFGWIHATQNKEITDQLIKSNLTCYAWEKMFENGTHIFRKNNEIVGEASVIDALMKYGSISENLKACILGNGNISRGAQRILNCLKIPYKVYKRKDEDKFKKEVYSYDIIINAILWDVNRKDHIIYLDDLIKFKKNSLIIDISCDHNGAIESSHPTSVDNPIYFVDGIMHYAVDHTPTLLYKDASYSISSEVFKYVDLFTNKKAKENSTLKEALIIENGVILDAEINKYQGRQ